MSTIFTKKRSKWIVDVAMLFCLIACMNGSSVFKELALNEGSEQSLTNVHFLSTLHCIMGMILIGFMAIHSWQHWQQIKALLSRKFLLKNKITAFTCFAFILLIVGLLAFMGGFTISTMHIHSLFAHIFTFLIFIHLLTRIFKLFDSDKTRTSFIQFDSRKCKACWKCQDICPENVIGKIDLKMHKHALLIISDKCRGCMKCVRFAHLRCTVK